MFQDPFKLLGKVTEQQREAYPQVCYVPLDSGNTQRDSTCTSQ